MSLLWLEHSSTRQSEKVFSWEILKRLYEQNPNGPDDYIFMRRDGRGRPVPIDRNWYQKEWRLACERLGIKNLRFHATCLNTFLFSWHFLARTENQERIFCRK